MVAAETTLLYLRDELPGAEAWAKRHGVEVTWMEAGLELRATFTHATSGEFFFLRATFDDYRYLPPVWTFTDGEWSNPNTFANYPLVASSPFGATLFINANGKPVICAPFSRLAYAEHGGPHNDWGGASNWLSAGQAGQVKAHYLGDMVQIIHRDFVHSVGRMG